MSANLMFQNGYYVSDLTVSWSNELKRAFQQFLHRPQAYKQRYLQKEFDYGFDGYSFMGQTDSQNQYAADLLHSMVVSNGTAVARFPEEFHTYLTSEFNTVRKEIEQVELALIEELNIAGLKAFYQAQMRHMISCNYYPKMEGEVPKARLSMHEDVSLFTVFPYGIDNQFYFIDAQGNKKHIAATNKVVVFPGYLLQLFTGGGIPALQHGVDGEKNQSNERFSFAFFSIPKANSRFELQKKRFSSQSYFEAYLGLY